MFTVDISAISFYARFPGLALRSRSKSVCTMDQKAKAHQPQDLICDALADMVPSTAEEIAEATGLDPVTAAACLDQMAARCRVMFNPLTKRFSLPRNRSAAGLAA
jgi:hypothetical protein